MLMMPAHSDGKTEHLSATTAASDTAVNSVTFADREDQLVAVSAGQRIGWFDLRQPSVVLKAPAHTVQYNQDEVNQLVFDRANGRLASCDDAGEVQVIQMPSRERIRTLKGKHTSICSNVQFRPRHPGHVLTGGLDCMLHWWDISRSVPLCIASCSSAPIAASGSNAAQVCNPPFVQSLHAHSSGDLLAAALGDGAVALYSLARNSGSASAGRARSRGRAPASSLLARGGGFSLEPLVRLEGHGASACAVHFPQFALREPGIHVFSASVDEYVLWWRVGAADDDRDSTANARSAPSHTGAGPKAAELVDNLHSTCIRSRLAHRAKVNWITSLSDRPSLLVADTSEVITLYEWGS